MSIELDKLFQFRDNEGKPKAIIANRRYSTNELYLFNVEKFNDKEILNINSILNEMFASKRITSIKTGTRHNYFDYHICINDTYEIWDDGSCYKKGYNTTNAYIPNYVYKLKDYLMNLE